MIKQQLKKAAKRMAKWPIVGRLVHIAVAVIRLPAQMNAYSELNRRLRVFEMEQIPTLLQTLADLNHRQISSAREYDNLVNSIPVALRKITREMSEIRQILGNEASSVAYLLGRVEFVRRELMFEMRYGTKTPTTDGQKLKSKVEILNPEKLAAARNHKLRLNLGCGHIPLDGYINIDRRALPGVDIVAELDELPLKLGEVDEIFSAHLLEHFPQEQLRRELLPYYYSLLKEGGVFRAVVPNAEVMIQKYTEGDYRFDDIREIEFGGQDYDGDFEYNMFTPESIKKLLEEAGFTATHVNATGGPNGKSFELEISACRDNRK